MEGTNISAEQMNRNARRGWFYFLIGVIWPGIFALLVRSEFRSFDFSEPYLTSENQTIVMIAALVTAALFFAAIFLRLRFTKKAILEQNRELVLKGLIYGLQASALISMIGLVLAFVFEYRYFFVWNLFSIFVLLLFFPRLKPFLDASFEKI